MKLINKLTLWYLAITTLVLLASGVIVFYRVQAGIEQEVSRRLKRDIDHVAQLLREGASLDSIRRMHMEVKELNWDAPLIPMQITDSMGVFSLSRRAVDRKFMVASSYKINGRHLHISAYNFIAEPDEILEGILASLGVTFVILLVFVGMASRQMSQQILSNFNQTLKTIQSFTLKQKNRIKLAETNTYEFKELNEFVEKMTNKALDDYQSLKEFSENASHELQTPLAIIRGKLELLIDTPIDSTQASLIEGINDAIQKLSAINQSLILLTKLENQEYPAHDKINFSLVVENSIASFRELIEMKSVTLTTKIQPAVFVNLNPMLADIMFTNLFSNAIRHNHVNGSINISLSDAGLIIENSGEPPNVPPWELFKRFKKDKQSTDSTGLGLAIVKQICDVSNFSIRYDYRDSRHILSIFFLPIK